MIRPAPDVTFIVTSLQCTRQPTYCTWVRSSTKLRSANIHPSLDHCNSMIATQRVLRFQGCAFIQIVCADEASWCLTGALPRCGCKVLGRASRDVTASPHAHPTITDVWSCCPDAALCHNTYLCTILPPQAFTLQRHKVGASVVEPDFAHWMQLFRVRNSSWFRPFTERKIGQRIS